MTIGATGFDTFAADFLSAGLLAADLTSDFFVSGFAAGFASDFFGALAFAAGFFVAGCASALAGLADDFVTGADFVTGFAGALGAAFDAGFAAALVAGFAADCFAGFAATGFEEIAFVAGFATAFGADFAAAGFSAAFGFAEPFFLSSATTGAAFFGATGFFVSGFFAIQGLLMELVVPAGRPAPAPALKNVFRREKKASAPSLSVMDSITARYRKTHPAPTSPRPGIMPCETSTVRQMPVAEAAVAKMIPGIAIDRKLQTLRHRGSGYFL